MGAAAAAVPASEERADESCARNAWRMAACECATHHPDQAHSDNIIHSSDIQKNIIIDAKWVKAAN